jgi:FKBP-type peptidyl-prolyl cis-trans isomerase 2
MVSFRSIGVMSLIALSALAVAACGAKQQPPAQDPNVISADDIVSVDYAVSWSDGSVFATNKSGTDITWMSTDLLDQMIKWSFEAGDDDVLWGESTLGASLNTTLQGTVSPQQSSAETDYDFKKIQRIPVDAFLSGQVPNEGDSYEIGNTLGYVTALTGEDNGAVIIDLNPRETRDTLSYTVTITNIQKPLTSSP